MTPFSTSNKHSSCLSTLKKKESNTGKSKSNPIISTPQKISVPQIFLLVAQDSWRPDHYQKKGAMETFIVSFMEPEQVRLCHPSIPSSVRPSISPSVHPSIHLSIRSSIYPSICPTIHSFIRSSIRPPIRLSVHPSILLLSPIYLICPSHINPAHNFNRDVVCFLGNALNSNGPTSTDKCMHLCYQCPIQIDQHLRNSS